MKKICLATLCLSLFGFSEAQSYHFSQFFSTPLLTNPAQTGYTPGTYRVASNLRSQAMAGGSPFLTGYISGDVSPLRKKLPEGHKAGAGIYLMTDQALGGALRTEAVGLSLAYHVGLDVDGMHSLGVGFQGAYHQKRLDYSRLSFASQFGQAGFDPSLPVGEEFAALKRSYFDVNAGLLYNANLENKSLFVGVSMYNLLKHKSSMLWEEFQMPTRFVAQAGAQFFVGESDKIYCSGTHMNQASVNATTLGGAYGLQITDNEKNEINFGLWYRLGDAVIPYIGYRKGGLQIGLTYDYTVSALKTGAQVRNGYELTLIFAAPDNSSWKPFLPWY